jgi:hypothetical protein
VECVTAAVFEDELVAGSVDVERDARARRGLLGRDADRERNGDATRENDRQRDDEDDADRGTDRANVHRTDG